MLAASGLLASGAVTLAIGGTSAAKASAIERPAPPSAKEVREATRRFEATHPGVAHASPTAKPGPHLDGRGGRATARARDSASGGVGDGNGEGNGQENGEGNGQRLFPRNRVVALYGAPQLGATIIGRKSVRGAKRRLRRQALAYEGGARRPVVPAFDLIGTIATSSRGPDRKYRSRQSDEVIRAYLRRARSLDGRLILDIQPGRASFLEEVRAHRRWLREPDVDVALDAEWNVGRRGIPGRTEGSVGARQLNRVAAFLRDLVAEQGLPPKLMIVHQFRRGSLKRPRKIRQRPGVQTTLDFDGIGTPAAKRSGYRSLAVPGLFNGFALFYRLDTRLMRPRAVIRLDPPALFVMYQ